MPEPHNDRFWLDLIAELAETVSQSLLNAHGEDGWQDSPIIETLARVAALFEADGRSVPPPILDVLRRAAEAGRPIGVA
jgi:hypothetical protein